MLSESWTSFWIFWGQGEHDFILTPARCHGALPSLSLALSLVLVGIASLCCRCLVQLSVLRSVWDAQTPLCIRRRTYPVAASTNLAEVGILALWIIKDHKTGDDIMISRCMIPITCGLVYYIYISDIPYMEHRKKNTIFKSAGQVGTCYSTEV